jgi:hypothetical protein
MAPNTSYHGERVGDIHLRFRTSSAEAQGTAAYTSFATSTTKATPILPAPAGELAAAIVGVVPFGGGGNLTVERHYAAATDKKGLKMWFVLTNR